MSMQQDWRVNIDYGAAAGVTGMEMRRCMVIEIHLDDDSVEPADFRHCPGFPALWA